MITGGQIPAGYTLCQLYNFSANTVPGLICTLRDIVDEMQIWQQYFIWCCYITCREGQGHENAATPQCKL
jgi:hypothetical protein